jgi:hypothetical protein
MGPLKDADISPEPPGSYSTTVAESATDPYAASSFVVTGRTNNHRSRISVESWVMGARSFVTGLLEGFPLAAEKFRLTRGSLEAGFSVRFRK